MLVYGGTHCFRPEFSHASMLFAPSLQDVWRFHIPSQTWTAVVTHDPLPECSPAAAAAVWASLVLLLALATGVCQDHML